VVVQLRASAGGAPVALAKDLVRPFASGVMAPLAAYLASERDAASAVMARQADLLVHPGLPRPSVMAEAATARDGATVTSNSSTTVAVAAAPAGLLELAGDVNRDGVEDVLESRYDGTGPSTLTLYARGGKRGGVLWTRKITVTQNHFDIALPLPTGAASTPGVLVLDIATSTPGGTTTETMNATGLGRTGKTLWTHRESGTITNTSSGFSMRHVPELVRQLNGTTRGADLLLARLDASSTASTTGSDTTTSSLTPYRLNTTAGRLTQLGATVTSTTGVPFPASAGDPSGDHLDDLVITDPGTGVHARSGVDGHALWDNTSLTVNDGAFAQQAGPVTPAAGRPRRQ
ncbi:MAG: hypothetical protein H7233_11310, partial [Pseudorhodobacter sp.]|nr:hypothetical protein [Frankiaceae bacterium]